jgi:uncharacterized protein YfaS (alpha-2-macroglobulin family)
MSYRRTVAVVTLLALTFSVVLLAENRATPPAPVAGNRFLAHLSTDKPIYRAHERVYFRGVVLGAADHIPLPDAPNNYCQLQITGPKGETLFTNSSQIADSVAAFNWDVPADATGGQYTAKLSFPWTGYPPAERKFDIRAYRAPRLKGEIVFLREGYGPGDTVKASLHVERAEGGLPAGANVTASAVVDGADAWHGSTTVDAAGNCSVEFKLPTSITRGDGTLSLAVADGGVVEPIAKTIPILINTLDISFYPEGGDLVAGLPCRVYVQALTPSQKPADLVGEILDSQNVHVVDVTTTHEGRGRFTFTPAAGESYVLKLSQPSGITRTFALPAAKDRGVVLQSTADTVAGGDSVGLDLTSSEDGVYTVTLSKRQIEAASTNVRLTAGKPSTVSLTPPSWADGALVATVKNSQGTPVAERLIFRKSLHALHVTITPNQSSYVPGDGVTLTIKTTDDNGRAVPAVVGLTATDQSVLRMIEKRERAPRLAEMVLLENDVKDLADAQIYLDPNDPKAANATDLLLGTQGWRRFATVDADKFVQAYGERARRAIATRDAPIVTDFGSFEGGDGGMMLRDRARAMDEVQLGAAMPINAPDGAAFADHSAAGKFDLQKLNGNIDKDLPQQDQAGLPAFDLEQAKVASVRPMPPMPVIRVYAHDLRPNRAANDRVDFAETLYWAAGIKTDDSGTASVSFKLNDSVTTFEIAADGFDNTGALGEATSTISSNEPFYIEPKLPLEVSAGDVVKLPIAAINSTANDLNGVQINISAGDGISVAPLAAFDLATGQRAREIATLQIGSAPGVFNFIASATGGSYSDKVTRPLVVVPLGFPTQINRGGTLLAASRSVHPIEIPDSVISGTMKASATLYPTPLANLTEALQSMLQEPNGCFEQTSSTNYPLVMADQYFTTHAGVDPTLISRSNDLLDKGYARLTGFECKNKGYEWFGEDPGHECLSAYGLLEFTDMSAVRPVDQKMLENTRSWLLARRDGKGGYTHERRSLHTWITDPGCANGYCTWALLECGQTGLDTEVSSLRNDAETDSNAYVKALAANVLFLAGDHAGAKHFMDALAGQQDTDGHVKGATTTVVGSGGDSLEIETTSLATLAWLRDPAYAANVEQAIHFLADSCKGGRYGSTQSTVLALRAIVTYDNLRAHPTKAGSAQLFVDGQAIGAPISFDEKTTGALTLPEFSDRMTVGKHAVELRMTDGSDLPYAVSVSFNSVTPSSSDQCKLGLATSLKDSTIEEGAATEEDVTVTNRTADTLPTPIAIIGLPGGLEPRHDQLKELVKSDRIAAYEVRGREVILYWRDIQPNEKIEIPLSVTAAIPGKYTAPASRAYLYYTDEFKQWQAGTSVTITPK